ncbi:DUF7065 domain-containing protein [Gordonia sp. KTR9]|uniref:DUF7065 domain-containing protein n=1 Tax=Gordonia sp. KTR9 TaxID=337191 RepID=UPI00027DE954|nr:hypothetical protein [Gordonia sp. KTR9]AFR49413.1 hypothetical protein KTR9_2776 [Gordonia sp. KTR9]
MTSTEAQFTAIDDELHPVGDSFYETETFWFSFFVPERDIGAWIYTSIRQNVGATAGGLWMWDRSATLPWDIPFYENFTALKMPTIDGQTLRSPTGARIDTVEPGMVYDLHYEDRDRISLELRFTGLEAPVPLRKGAPPYPVASHYDQTGHVVGHLVLDGERIEVDCYAMRDRSWGPRHERGYQRVGYTWLASQDLSMLTFSAPTATSDDIHSGYIRRGEDVSRIVGGHRIVGRDPKNAWVETLDISVVDEHGNEWTAAGTARSRFVLPGATNVCVNTLLAFDVGGETVFGEDQDVWAMKQFRSARQRA